MLHLMFFVNILDGRINKEVLSACFQPNKLHKDRTKCYICGPEPMIDLMERMLKEIGLNQDQVLYEKWW